MSDCIPHSGYIDPRGRGTVCGARFGHRYNISAHRAAWMEKRGVIPAGMFVCHSCDNPSCVNIDHLFLGTHKENMRDMKSKGRQANGERQHLAKLSEDQVTWIRKLWVAGRMTLKEVGDLFGVSDSTVLAIHQRRTWSHVY